MILKPSPTPSSRFHYNSKTKMFSAEASDLRNLRMGRVYDDACDEGFTIISDNTGKPAVFAMHREETDHEGDLLAWHFNCVTPGLTHLKAVIFND